MKNDTILLTGATGFLGSHLLESLIKGNYRVVITKRSFSDIWRINHLLRETKSYDLDKIALENIFEENKIDVIIHTATNYGRNGEKIFDVIKTNLFFPLKLIEVALCFNVKAFFNTDTLLNKYLNNYTLSKKQFVEWLKVFSNQIKVVNLKIEHIYGPKDDNKKFVNWLINEMINERDEIKLTAGEQKRDFIYVKDVISAYLIILKNLDKINNFSQFDIGTGNFIKIKDFVIKTKELAENILKKNIKTFLNFGALPYREYEIMDIEENLVDIHKLGWCPIYNLDYGLSETIKYLLERIK